MSKAHVSCNRKQTQIVDMGMYAVAGMCISGCHSTNWAHRAIRLLHRSGFCTNQCDAEPCWSSAAAAACRHARCGCKSNLLLPKPATRFSKPCCWRPKPWLVSIHACMRKVVLLCWNPCVLPGVRLSFICCYDAYCCIALERCAC